MIKWLRISVIKLPITVQHANGGYFCFTHHKVLRIRFFDGYAPLPIGKVFQMYEIRNTRS